MVAILGTDATTLLAKLAENTVPCGSVTTSPRRSGPNDRVLEDEMATVTVTAPWFETRCFATLRSSP
jgi:hypothetical protein